ncbi:hypothetical protein, partial [Phascolarctobacterium succinatutens]|uniref:hypothetical protein n=1 Tax=Phascolarctobacterium succinatutens TaxID=626940 RepID=UPI003079C6C3
SPQPAAKSSAAIKPAVAKYLKCFFIIYAPFFHLLKLLLFSMLIICPGAKKRPTPKHVLG